MTERDYMIRLVIHGRIVYETVMRDETSPSHAISWALYWMPCSWRQCDHGEPIHVKVSVMRGGEPTTWKAYDNPYLEDVARIQNFTTEDLKCMMAGQHLVWRILGENGEPVNGRLFHTYKDAFAFKNNEGSWMRSRISHVWVDGWYDEQYSWERKEVKGYKGLTMDVV